MPSAERNYPEKRSIEAADDTSLPQPGVVAHTRCTYNQRRESGAVPTVAQITESQEQESSRHIDDGAASNDLADDLGKIDGGATAWLVVLGAWCASFCSYGWINSVGIFQEYYEIGPLSDYTPSQIAWIPALQIFFMSALGPINGYIFDRYGPRLLLAVGSSLHVFGLMMASISTQYYQILLSQGVCSAIGVAAVFLASIGCVSGWFDRRRGLAFGALATGSSLGGVIFPIMLTRLIDSVGYGWAMRTGAFMIAALLIVANLMVRRRNNTVTNTNFSKELMTKPFREVPFFLLLVGLALVPFGLYTPINYLPTAAIRAGINKSMAQNLVSIYNGASLVGRLSSGILADKLGRFNVFITACYIAGILIVAMWIPGDGDAATIAFSVLFGLSSGAYIALQPAMVAQISPIEEVGYRNGLVNIAQSVGGMFATPIAGAILEQPGGLVGLKAFAGVFLLAGTTGVLWSRFASTGLKFKVVM